MAAVFSSLRPSAAHIGVAWRCAGWFVSSSLMLPGSAIVHADPLTAFDVKASVRRPAAAQTGAGLAQEAHAGFQRTSPVAGRCAVSAGADQAPFACAADLVFANGFD